MDPVEPLIHSFIVKVRQEVVVGNGDKLGWRGYVTHVPSGDMRYFEHLDEILAFVEPRLLEGPAEEGRTRDVDATDPRDDHPAGPSTDSKAIGGSEEDEMDSSPGGLGALQKQLEDANQAVGQAASEAANAQDALKRTRDSQAALQKAVDEATAATAAIDKAVATSVGPKATAERIAQDLKKALSGSLSQEQRAAVDAVVEAVGDQWDILRKQQDAAAAKLGDGQRSAAAKAADLAAVTEGLADAQGDLKGTAATIQGLSVRVTSLSNAAKAALDSKRPGAAYRQAGELERALEQLGGASDPKSWSAHHERIAQGWEEVKAAQAAKAEADDALATLKADQQAADTDLKAFEAKRDASIDEQIASLEQRWAAESASKPTKPEAAASSGEPEGSTKQSASESAGYAEASA